MKTRGGGLPPPRLLFPSWRFLDAASAVADAVPGDVAGADAGSGSVVGSPGFDSHEPPYLEDGKFTS